MMNLGMLRNRRNLFDPSVYGGASEDQTATPQSNVDTNSALDFGADDAMARASISNSSALASRPTTSTTNGQSSRLSLDDVNNQLQPGPSPLTDKYRALLAQGPPARTNPSVLQAIGAAMASYGARDPRVGIDLMNRPYNQKVQAYNLQRDTLGDAAKLESSDEADKVKRVMSRASVQNVMDDNSRAASQAEGAAEVNQGRIANWQSLIDQRANQAKTQGMRFTKDASTGHYVAFKPSDKSPTGYDRVDLGPVDESPDQKQTRAVSTSNQIGENQLGRNLYRDATNAGFREVENQNQQQRGQENADAALSRSTVKAATTAANSPTKEFQNRALAMRRLSDANPGLASEFDLTKGIAKTPRAKAALETELAGKVIMKDASGKPQAVGKADVAEAKKHGWTLVMGAQ